MGYSAVVKRILIGVLLLTGVSSAYAEGSPGAQPDSVSTEVAPESIPRDTRLRQRPGDEPRPVQYPAFIYESVPDIQSSASEFSPVFDRWRMFYTGKWYDPYNQNVLKADIPVFGHPDHPWFFELAMISDTLFEYRQLPIPVGGASTENPEATDTFGDGRQGVVVENFVFSIALVQGNTTFRPQDFEFRAVPVVSVNHADVEEDGALRADPTRGTDRTDNHIGFLELFVDYHLANLTHRYDFLSLRAGIQKFNSDFRGFIFSDEAPGVRLFGNFEDNIYQYNLGWFSRLDKDTNSGINTFDSRHEDVFVANLYRQDTPVLGHTVQASVLHRIDSAGNYGQDYDNNGFLVRPAAIGDERPKNLQTTYFGVTGDGHFDRINSSAALYYVTGSESHNQIAGKHVDISASMAALELSYDKDWMRFRTSFFWASGDDDAFDDEANGFDAIFDVPNFAGGDISFWQRQGIPLVGGGGVNLVNRNSLLPNLRPGKEEGQSNFVNPGLRLFNLGVDFEITPKLKLINNVSFLQFDDTSSLRAVRQDGSIDRSIGFDVSSGLLYRPFLNNNVQFRFGGAVLFPEEGTENLFGDETLFDIFSNVILQY